jgi:hypothetical protein
VLVRAATLVVKSAEPDIVTITLPDADAGTPEAVLDKDGTRLLAEALLYVEVVKLHRLKISRTSNRPSVTGGVELVHYTLPETSLRSSSSSSFVRNCVTHASQAGITLPALALLQMQDSSAASSST